MLRHAAWVRRAAFGLTRDVHRAEDLAQETWAIALSRPPSSGENIRGWLGTVLRNAARSVARGEARRRGREQESARAEALPPADSLVEEAELAAQLAREVRALPEPYRTAIVLVYFEGRGAASIAREKGIPEATVRSHVHRGLERLRERLARERLDDRGAWIALLADHAARRARTGALSSPAIPGAGLLTAMTTKTLLALAAAAAAVLLALLVHSRSVGSRRPEMSAAVPASLAPSSETRPLVATPLGERVPAIPAAVGTEASPRAPVASGSVLVRLRWAESGTPAKDVFVGARYRDDPSHLEWREARSGADGSALLEDVHEGPLHVRTDREAGADVDVRAGERAETEIVIPRGIDVSGRVVDAGEKGVAGASITLDWGSNPSYVVAEADPAGRFEIRDVESGQFVGARAPGHEPSSPERVEGDPGSKIDLALRLESDGGEVEGVVLDLDGQAIPDALVCVGEECTWQSGRGKPHAPGPRVHTGKDGRFHVEGVSTASIQVKEVPAGTIPVTARAHGFAPARETVSVRPGSLARIELRLGRGATLEGVVLGEDGSPVPGAKICVALSSHGPGDPLGCVQAESGEGGRYELACVPSGEREVRVETEQDGQASERGTLAEGERRRLDFHLSRGNVIAGRLVDGQGNGLAGWLVDGNCTARRFRDEDFRAMGWRGYTRSGDDGSFLIPNCPSLEVTLSAFPPDGVGGQPAAMLKVEKPPARDLRFVVPDSTGPTAWIRGRLRMTDGSTIPSIELFAFDPDHKSPRATKAEIDRKSGEFQVGPLGPGSWGLALQSDLVCPIDVAPVELTRDGDRDVGTIDLVAAGFVRARVVHREKGDWKRVRLGLCDPDVDRRDGHNDRVTYWELSSAPWKSPPLAPGTQEVRIRLGDGGEERRTLVIRSREETLLEIEVD